MYKLTQRLNLFITFLITFTGLAKKKDKKKAVRDIQKHPETPPPVGLEPSPFRHEGNTAVKI